MTRARDSDLTVGLVHPLWVPARREPDHRSEMVTQLLCGERVVVVESEGPWLRGRGEDGYEAWIYRSGLMLTEDAASWEQEAAWSLGTPILGLRAGRGYLPWGARVRVGRKRIGLPGGEQVTAEDRTAIVEAGRLKRRFPMDPAAVVRTASEWLGVPYLWGGRTNTGCDCSGFVQSVLRVHGLILPRDSRDQGAGGKTVEDTARAMSDLQPGDLLFFAPEGKGITHVAVSTGGTGIIHSSTSRGVVAEDELSAGASSDELQRLLLRSFVGTTRPLEGTDE